MQKKLSGKVMGIVGIVLLLFGFIAEGVLPDLMRILGIILVIVALLTIVREQKINRDTPTPSS